MSIRISIIIITWNQLERLKRCLESIHDVVTRNDIETIIIDNGSNDKTDSFIGTHYPQILYLRNECNRGVAFARNQGIKVAKGNKIMLLDNDTIANKEAIFGMEQYMNKNNNIGICGCMLTDENGNIQQSFKPFPGLFIKTKNIFGLSNDYVEVSPSEIIEPTYVIGACQMIKREVIDDIGILDENIFYGPEDADFCIRASKAGYKVVYLPQFSIIHLWRRATRRSLFSKLSLKHFVSLIYFYFKHHRF